MSLLFDPPNKTGTEDKNQGMQFAPPFDQSKFKETGESTAQYDETRVLEESQYEAPNDLDEHVLNNVETLENTSVEQLIKHTNMTIYQGHSAVAKTALSSSKHKKIYWFGLILMLMIIISVAWGLNYYFDLPIPQQTLTEHALSQTVTMPSSDVVATTVRGVA